VADLAPRTTTTLADLLALLPDNTTGEITPADMRTIVTELWNGSHPPVWNIVNQGPFVLAAHAAWTDLAPPVTGVVTLDDPTTAQFCLSLNVDTLGANNAVQLGLDLSGATVVPVGSKPEQVLWIGGKQPVQATVEVTFLQALAAGTTNLAIRYTAQAAANVTALALIGTIVAGA
jgi:hypothetical protein